MKKNPILKFICFFALLLILSSCNKDNLEVIKPKEIVKSKTNQARAANYCASCLKYNFIWNSGYINSQNFSIIVFPDFGVPEITIEKNTGNGIVTIQNIPSGSYPVNQYFNSNNFRRSMVRIRFNYFGNYEYSGWYYAW